MHFKIKLHRYGKNWGLRSQRWWFEVVLGHYRIDSYLEPMNGWRHCRLRWPLTIWLGPLLILGQNWKRKQR